MGTVGPCQGNASVGVALHVDGECGARARSQPDTDIPVFDWNGGTTGFHPQNLVLSIRSGLNDQLAGFDLVGIYERDAYLFRIQFRDQCCHIRWNS